MTKKKLTLKFDPQTIEHLGVKMYSTLPPVLAELVANSYDSGAKNVYITLDDSNKTKKTITVIDDGSGMDFNDIENNFLVIGKNRRDSGDKTIVKGRKPIGKKGLGKLAYFGIAKSVTVTSVKAGYKNSFSMKWDKILSEVTGSYHPDLGDYNVRVRQKNGTIVVLSDIKRKTNFDSLEISRALSRHFIVDTNFTIHVKRNTEKYKKVDSKMRHEGLDVEMEWSIPGSDILNKEYVKRKSITGHIFATKKPVSPSTQMRGITIFSRKKLVNLPEYFSESQSSHFFSYVSGWIEADFIDELEEDVISTDRQSLIWDNDDMQDFRKKLQQMMGQLEKDWRKKRTERRTKELDEKTGVDLDSWFKKIPDSIRKKVEPIVRAIIEQSEFDEDQQEQVIVAVKGLAPEYTFFHYRNLHPTIQRVAGKYYKEGNYYTAFLEAMKKYVNESRKKALYKTSNDYNDIEHIFQVTSPKLSVIESYKKPDGSEFSDDTKKNIVEAHRMFSLAALQGARHPIAHEEIEDLVQSKLFTESDCLDALSLLSHLYNRLDNSVKMR